MHVTRKYGFPVGIKNTLLQTAFSAILPTVSFFRFLRLKCLGRKKINPILSAVLEI